MGLAISVGTLTAQTDDLQERMKGLPERFQYDPGKMESAGRAILQRSDAVDCDSLMIGEYLVLQAAVARRMAYCDLDTTGCGEAPPLLVYLRAAEAHLCGRFDEAVRGFRWVSEQTTSPRFAVTALQAEGVVHSDAGRPEEALACLVEAFERHPEECHHPLTLLNLAGAAAMVGRWEDVLKWADLADESLARELKGSKAAEFDPQWASLIAASRLRALAMLGRKSEAEQVFLHLPLRDVKVVGAAGVLRNYTSYALQTDAFAQFMGHLPELQAIAQIDSGATVRALGAHASLFEPWRTQVWGSLPLEQVWSRVRNLPTTLADPTWRDAAGASSDGANAAAWQAFLAQTERNRWKVAAGLLALVTAGCVVPARGLGRARRKALRWNPEREGELVHALRKQVPGANDRPAGAELRWMLVAALRRRGLARLQGLGDGIRNLTRREEEFVMHLAAGLRTKEFARIHRLSASYVYNLSSSVRRKLQVPDSVELADFILSNERTEA